MKEIFVSIIGSVTPAPVRHGEVSEDEIFEALRTLPTKYTDLVITAANVARVGTGGTVNFAYNAGATITQGQSVYLDSTNKWQLAKADTATHSGYGSTFGVALDAASSGQPLAVLVPITGQTCQLNLGATLVADTIYVVSGANAGGIAPLADLTTGQFITILAFGISTSVVEMAGIYAYNLAHT